MTLRRTCQAASTGAAPNRPTILSTGPGASTCTYHSLSRLHFAARPHTSNAPLLHWLTFLPLRTDDPAYLVARWRVVLPLAFPPELRQWYLDRVAAGPHLAASISIPMFRGSCSTGAHVPAHGLSPSSCSPAWYYHPLPCHGRHSQCCWVAG